MAVALLLHCMRLVYDCAIFDRVQAHKMLVTERVAERRGTPCFDSSSILRLRPVAVASSLEIASRSRRDCMQQFKQPQNVHSCDGYIYILISNAIRQIYFAPINSCKAKFATRFIHLKNVKRQTFAYGDRKINASSNGEKIVLNFYVENKTDAQSIQESFSTWSPLTWNVGLQLPVQKKTNRKPNR